MEPTTTHNKTTTTRTLPEPTATNPMTRFSIGEEEDDAPLTIKRPRLSSSSSSGPTSQSPRNIVRLHFQSRVVAEEEDDEPASNSVEIEDVGSDSEDPDDGNEIEDVDDDDDDDELELVEEDGESEEEEAVGRVLPRAVSCAVVGNGSVCSEVSGELKVVLTDPDVLDCPICLDPLTTPVFQCENGHIACSLCCTKVKRKCPSCCMPIGYNRCRAIEKVIESVKVSCKNAQYGCKESMTYSKKIEHEQMCPYVTCFCPHPSCPFLGSSKNMYIHFGMQHAAITTRFTFNTTFLVHASTHQKHMFLQEQHESVVFVLNREVKERSQALSIDCVGPSTLKTAFEYQITATNMESTLSLKCVPEIFSRWSEHPLKKNYLMVPFDFFGLTEALPLHLCIKKVTSPV